MIQRISFLALLCLGSGSSALSSAVVTVKGKLISMTATDYVVQTARQRYRIARSAVHPKEAEKITRPEVDVSLSVPMEAIKDVKAKKANE